MKTFFHLTPGLLVLSVILTLIPPPAQARECGHLCSEEFWKGATPADVQAELAKGSDPQARDEDGLTPLHWAARHHDSPAVVKALLEAGADLTARDRRGGTPLHWAARYNDSPAMAKALLEAGRAGFPALTNSQGRQKDAKGWTPLHVAARWNKNPAVVLTLLPTGLLMDPAHLWETSDGETA